MLYPARALAQALFSASAEVGSAFGQSLEVTEIPTNQIIVKFKASPERNSLQIPMQADQLERLSEAGGVSLAFVRQMSGEAQVLRLPERLPADQVNEIAQRLTALPEVEYAEADAILPAYIGA